MDRRQPASLTFVIDTSGSMEREGRLELVKDALRLLVDGLDRRDTIAIVTFGDDGRVLLRPTPASETNAILGVIEQLQPGGSTNLEAGLRLGYDLARESLTENGIDRVVLASDGVANVGLTDPESILGAIERDAQAGIELVSVGVGMGNYNDTLLEQLADKGDGFYAYVNVLDEARRLFEEDLTGTLQTVALDAKAQVEFDRDIVAAYRLVGYENRDIADNAFVDPNVEAGAIGAGHAVTALYALRLREDVGPQDVLGTVRLRWTDPESDGADEVERRITDERSRPHLRGRRPLLPVRRDRGRHGRGPAWEPMDRAARPVDRRRRRRPGGIRVAADGRGPRVPRAARPDGRDGRLSKATGRGVAEEERPAQAGSPASGSWRHRARRIVAQRPVGLGHGAGGELASTALDDALHRGIVLVGELDEEGAHLRVLGPGGVRDVGRPQDGLSGSHPRVLVADADPAPALDDDEPGHIRSGVRLHASAPRERELRDRATLVAVDRLPADPGRAGRAIRAAMTDSEPPDLDRHRRDLLRILGAGAAQRRRRRGGRRPPRRRMVASGSANFCFV